MLDSRGVIYAGREEGLNEWKIRFANYTDARTLDDAIVGADVFLGLSTADVLKPEMVRKMADNPIILALANPDPEIRPRTRWRCARMHHRWHRPQRLPQSGQQCARLPLHLPGRARCLRPADQRGDEAGSGAGAGRTGPRRCARQRTDRLWIDFAPVWPRVPDPQTARSARAAVGRAGGGEGGDGQRRSPAQIDLDEYRMELIQRQGLGETVRANIMNKARMGSRKRVVYGEGEHPKVIRAAYQVQEERIATPVLLGDDAEIRAVIDELGLDFAPEIIAPLAKTRDDYIETLVELRRRKGMTRARATSMMRSRNYYGLMMVRMGEADCFISGLTQEYPEVMRPALQLFGTRPGAKFASGCYLMIVHNRTYLFTDATVNIDPDAEKLAEIAILAADFARTLDLEPRVAMLSFSNFGSTPHVLSAKVQNAVQIVQQKRPDIVIDGEMQADTAVVPEIIEERYPFSQVKDANVLVFPDLGSANIAYKLLDRLTEAEAIGPILLGMGAPVHVLQAGDDVNDIVAMTAVAVMDAQLRETAAR
jgi:malate dehydrogenase (oxaloacetate-decarboxylating)(NADP+)